MEPSTLSLSPKGRRDSCGGSVLLTTILMVALLLLLAMAFSSRVMLEMRSTSSRQVEIEAKAHARLALMLAVAELQQAMGPDQRVSATAEILDEVPETLEIVGVNLPYTLGSWSTLLPNGDPILYRSADGYLTDRRNPADDAFHNHRNTPLRWLISGGDAPGFHPRTSTLTAGLNAVALGRNQGSDILAPLVPISGGGGDGAYAFHISDLGIAAPLVQWNELVDRQPDPTQADDGGYANLYTGTRRPYGELSETSIAFTALSSNATVADDRTEAKYVSRPTLGFNPDGTVNNPAIDLLNEYQQELTTHNEALIINTLDSGFKIDLTSFMNDRSEPGDASLSGSQGVLLDDRTPMIGHDRLRAFSPKFGALRDFMALGDLAGSSRTLAPRAPLHGGGHSDIYPDPVNHIQHGVHPYIVEYSTYVLPVINPAAPHGVSLLIYPRVTLWNPYNVTIDTSGYFVQINQRLLYEIRVHNEDGTYTLLRYRGSYFGDGKSADDDGARGNRDDLYFFLEPTQLLPGQSLVFTPAGAQLQALEPRDGMISNNRLSASEDITNLKCFYVHMDRRMAGAPIDVTSTFLQYDHTGTPEVPFQTQWVDSTAARLRISNQDTDYSRIRSLRRGIPRYPIVHTFDIHNWIRSNDGRWRWINRPPDPLLHINDLPVPPDNRTKLGIRFKAFQETLENRTQKPNGLWNFPLLEMANLRAPFYRRTPWDWLSDHPSVGQEYSFGPFTSEDQEQPGYLDPFMLPRFVNGQSESSPFMDTSSQTFLRYSLFDIPPAGQQAFSVGQFRQTPLTQEFSAPSFIIGESLATVTAPRDKSAFPANQYRSLWWQGLHEVRVPRDATWWQDEFDPQENYAAFDYRYETNHALWDRFFFSTLPENQTLEDYRNTALPHRRLRIDSRSGADLSAPTENLSDVIAEHLRLRNHHSVNSTSPIAWKSLLAMNMGMDIASGATEPGKVPFPGTSQPLGDGADSADASDSRAEETWTGYRQLDEDELDALTTRIIEQVKRRAPFISISDFVNRRLLAPQSDAGSSPSLATQTDLDLLSYAGPLEIAIRQAGLNANLQDFQLSASNDITPPAHNAPRLETLNVPTERFANAPAHLTQGKILETLGATLTARSDTFRIRAYGESRNSNGTVMAGTWCEAVVQRIPDYIDPEADDAITPVDQLTSLPNRAFGRCFVIQSFRWLSPEEL